MLDYIMELAAPFIALLLAILVPVATAALVRLFNKWGLDMEAQHRIALQSALHHAATVAVSKMTNKNIPKATAVRYVMNSVPDAVDVFGLTTSKIEGLLEPHFEKAMAEEKPTGDK